MGGHGCSFHAPTSRDGHHCRPVLKPHPDSGNSACAADPTTGLGRQINLLRYRSELEEMAQVPAANY